MSSKMFAISKELPNAPWRCGQDHGSRGLPGSACRSRVRGRAPLRVMSTLACCRAQPPCNHRKRAPPGRRTKTRTQNKHGTDTQWDICVHVPMWGTTKNTRLHKKNCEIAVASTRIHGRRSSNNPCKCSIYGGANHESN